MILVGVLLVIELAGLPFYEREDTDDWIVQGVALVLSLVGIVAAVGALWRSRGHRGPDGARFLV